MTVIEIEEFAERISESYGELPQNMRIVVKAPFENFVGKEKLVDHKGITYIKYNTTSGIPIYIIE